MHIQSKLSLLINAVELPHAETFIEHPFLQSSRCLYKINKAPSYCLIGLHKTNTTPFFTEFTLSLQDQ